MDYTEILILVLVFTFGGFVKGVLGIGLPALLIGLLTFFYEPRVAVAMILLPIMTTNIRQALKGGSVLEIGQRFWLLLVISMSFILLTALVGGRVPLPVLLTFVGVGMVLFALNGLLVTTPVLPPRFDRAAQIAAGVGSGILGGLTAIWGPPLAIYLMSLRLEKKYFVQVLGLLFAAQSIPLTAGFVLSGELTARMAVLSAALLVPTFAGMFAGERIRDRIDAVLFFRLFLGAFLVLGLNLIRRGLFGG